MMENEKYKYPFNKQNSLQNAQLKKTSVAGRIKVTELYSQSKENTLYSKIITNQELMLMTSASKQRCPLDTKYLLCRLEVGVQVH